MSEKPGQEDYPPQPDNPVGSCKRSARWRAHHVFDGRPLRDPTSTCQLLLGRWIGLLGRRGPPRHGLPRLVLGQWGRSSQAPTWGESPSTQVERRLEVTFLRLVQRIRDAKTSSHGADLGFLRLVQRIRLSVRTASRDTIHTYRYMADGPVWRTSWESKSEVSLCGEASLPAPSLAWLVCLS